VSGPAGVIRIGVDLCRLWQEHGYQNGRVVFVSCESGQCIENRAEGTAILASISNASGAQCFYNTSKVSLPEGVSRAR
jgi:hypothetical protein